MESPEGTKEKRVAFRSDDHLISDGRGSGFHDELRSAKEDLHDNLDSSSPTFRSSKR